MDTAEYNPFETIKPMCMVRKCHQASLNNNVEKVIALSTDKAASPINLWCK